MTTPDSTLVSQLTKIHPLLAHDLENPFIPPDVFAFVEHELAKLDLNWNALWFDGPATMDAARQAVNYIRAKYGLLPLPEPAV